jgi:hypothetical protein
VADDMTTQQKQGRWDVLMSSLSILLCLRVKYFMVSPEDLLGVPK